MENNLEKIKLILKSIPKATKIVLMEKWPYFITLFLILLACDICLDFCSGRLYKAQFFAEPIGVTIEMSE